jgi:transcriptional regulator of arginine metabolism
VDSSGQGLHIHVVAPNTSQGRRQVIREILEAGSIASQEQLLEELLRRGVKTTQPVLSRDLRALGVAKRGGLYQLLEEDRITPLEALHSMLRGTAQAGANLIVVHCEPGAASAVARALEAEEIPGLLGTVAGDDTVFVAVSSTTAGARVRESVAACL